MKTYSIFKIGGDLFKVYDQGDDWQVKYTKGSSIGELWFTKHRLTMKPQESFNSMLDKLLSSPQYDDLDIEWIQ